MIEWQQFVYIACIGLIGSVAGTFLTEPTPKEVIENYYRKVRPFGLWGKFKSLLSPAELKATEREHFYDLISVPFTFGWMLTILLMPMQLMIREYRAFAGTFVLFAICMIGLYFFWYRQLPPAQPKEAQVAEKKEVLQESK
jgi:hypothetical protein